MFSVSFTMAQAVEIIDWTFTRERVVTGWSYVLVAISTIYLVTLAFDFENLFVKLSQGAVFLYYPSTLFITTIKINWIQTSTTLKQDKPKILQ